MKDKTTKLKKMKLTSVDLVRAGANQNADICLYKSADGENSGENTQEIDKSRQNPVDSGYNNSKTTEVDLPRKEGKTMLKIDKSLFTAEELEQYEALIAKALVDPEAGEEEMEDQKPPMMQRRKAARPVPPMMQRRKAARPVPPQFLRDDEEEDDTEKAAPFADEEDDTEKAAPFADEDEMDKGCRTRKSADEGEDVEKMQEMFKSAFDRQEARIAELEKSLATKEFADIAKKYAPLGEDETTLAKTLFDMYQADEELYNSYVDSLEKSLDLVNKSGMFVEIGKSGYQNGPSSAVGRVEAIAKSYIKKDPGMTYEQAIAKAWENNPDLIAEYEAEYNA